MFILHFLNCVTLGNFYSIIQKILKYLQILGEEIAFCSE
jgi:hypothetical protein